MNDLPNRDHTPDRNWLDAADQLDRSSRELRAVSELVCSAEDLHIVDPENLGSLLDLLADTFAARSDRARAAVEALRGDA